MFEYILEETLSAKDKKEIPDSMYGLIYTDENGNKIRKFPLNDESHVRQAAIFFDRAKDLSDDQKRELARNIVKRAKELDMDYSGWDALKPYLEKHVNESFNDMFGPVIQETYQPYDEYLKLHQYDPKTNTIVIDGKRVNAGMKGSNKERNRMNKFLRENNYNPKDGTIETRVKNSDGSKHRVQFDINSHTSGETAKYEYRKDGKVIGKDFDVSMSPKSISQKPGISNQTYGHEVTHGDIHLNPQKYSGDLKEVNQQNKDEYDRGDYTGGNPAQVAHAVNNEEKLADYHSTVNNPYGTSWHQTSMNKFKSGEESESKKAINSINGKTKNNIAEIEQKRNDPKSEESANRYADEYVGSMRKMLDSIKAKKERGEQLDPVEQTYLNSITDESIEKLRESAKAESKKTHNDYIDKQVQTENDRRDRAIEKEKRSINSFNNEMNNRQNYVQNRLNQQNKTNDQQPNNQTNTNNGYDKNGFKHQPSPNESNNNNVSQESFNDMFGEVIQEAYDAITGKEIPINHAYTMKEMAKRSLSLDEAKAIEKDELIPIKPPKTDEVYFGSSTNYMPEIDLKGPLFVSPYKGIASIFIWRDTGLRDRIPRGSYNHQYEEWINFDEKKMKNPLKEVHVYVEGAPFLEPFTVEHEGYIHCISTKDYLNNFFRKPWMTKDLEYLIANTDNMKVEFTRSIKCKVKYYIKGRPSPKGKQYGPSKGGILQYIHKIAKSIHAKYKADQKEPTGNQNCLLCAWCAEASIRGGEYLPRPVYSPRDPALEIVPGDIVGGVTKNNPTSFYDMLEHLRGDSIKQPFARWYCHVKWGHGNGGHEFLIVKIDEDGFNIMDPQQGIVRPLHADDSYMKDVDWEGTYFCRIDDKPFKYMKLDQINDPKKTLPWDPKKDIPYMLKHGMCSKEEAEKELKKMETNLFTSELKKSLKESPIQEGAWQDIKNGVNPYSMKRVFHITKEGHLDGQVFKPRVPEYLDKYDPTKPNFEDVDSPRVCFSPSIEGCLNAILVNIGRWKTADKLGDWYVYIPEKPLKDYKHKTTRELIKDKKVYDANVTNEIWIEEPVRLKQYGIIHVDQVSDVSKKKTVPMLNGKSGERNKYNFKWHWLVKPKVLKNVPYEYTPKSVCEDMVMDMKRYNYGFVKNGKISKGSSEDYDKYYRLESPEEFEENGGGICYDYVEFQEGYLDAYGFKCKKYFIYTETEDNDTHTFMLVEDGDGKLIYPESSFKLLEGCHVVKDVQEAIRKITEQIFNINNNAKKYDEIPYYVWEYEGHPPYGSDMKTCHEYFTKGEPIYEGIAKK